MGWTFTAVTIAWVFFRANDIVHATQYLTQCSQGFEWPAGNKATSLAAIVSLLIADWDLTRKSPIQFERMVKWPFALILTIITLSFLARSNQASFIYFQF